MPDMQSGYEEESQAGYSAGKATSKPLTQKEENSQLKSPFPLRRDLTRNGSSRQGVDAAKGVEAQKDVLGSTELEKRCSRVLKGGSRGVQRGGGVRKESTRSRR